jgi:cobalt-zinc-cadmium efflux system protein
MLWVTILNFSITIVQIIGGIVSNSIALISDALHNLGDTSAIFLAWLANKKAQKSANQHKTFGYKRIEILTALFNAVVLVGICIFLLYESYERILTPEPIKGKLMLIVASFGLLANLISVMILKKDKDHNLNMKSAYLHLLGDTLSSVAVIIGGIAIWLYNFYWLDPIITISLSLYILKHTWHIIKDTIDILMQATPRELNLEQVKTKVESIEKIDNIHHVHAWKLDDQQIHFEGHINLKNNVDMTEMMDLKLIIKTILHEEFNVSHITLEFGYGCCPDGNELINKKNE